VNKRALILILLFLALGLIPYSLSYVICVARYKPSSLLPNFAMYNPSGLTEEELRRLYDDEIQTYTGDPNDPRTPDTIPTWTRLWEEKRRREARSYCMNGRLNE
jgi:hypothetical protein